MSAGTASTYKAGVFGGPGVQFLDERQHPGRRLLFPQRQRRPGECAQLVGGGFENNGGAGLTLDNGARDMSVDGATITNKHRGRH